jgi:steroid 5-alpha reductase family enzyme
MIADTGRLLLFGWLGAALLMLVLWLIQRRTRNAGLVDAGWAGSLGLLGLGDALFAGGAGPHRLLVGALTATWGLRLAVHLLRDRILGRPEEGRYVALRARWGRRADAFFFPFFQAQALLAAVLSLPFALAAQRSEPRLDAVQVAGALLWLFGLVFESTADAQLARFKAGSANRGRVCDVGLWRFSRHPNYFGEWLIWCGFALLALTGPHGAWGLISPALMLVFILFITGVPPTEAQALRSRGEAYRAYQRRTSVFVPWFPKRRTAR